MPSSMRERERERERERDLAHNNAQFDCNANGEETISVVCVHVVNRASIVVFKAIQNSQWQEGKIFNETYFTF